MLLKESSSLKNESFNLGNYSLKQARKPKKNKVKNINKFSNSNKSRNRLKWLPYGKLFISPSIIKLKNGIIIAILKDSRIIKTIVSKKNNTILYFWLAGIREKKFFIKLFSFFIKVLCDLKI